MLKVTLIEFLIPLSEKPWNARFLVEQRFIDRVLEEGVESGDSFGLISHRFLKAVAEVYAKCWEVFDLPASYYTFLN